MNTRNVKQDNGPVPVQAVADFFLAYAGPDDTVTQPKLQNLCAYSSRGKARAFRPGMRAAQAKPLRRDLGGRDPAGGARPRIHPRFGAPPLPDCPWHSS
ncbi:MAG: hypothetical protein LBR22_04375, partial [Desulfovibrio sp.]|nr:hypothetical protein [Desulfovibrio sp.]